MSNKNPVSMLWESFGKGAAEEGGKWSSRIFFIVLILIVVPAPLAAIFLGGEDNSSIAALKKAIGMEKEEKEQKENDPGMVIREGNYGFREEGTKFSWITSATNFTPLEPGDYKGQKPFNELISGEHTREFEVRFSTTDGGYVMGLGETLTHYVAKGTLTATYDIEAFRLLVQKAEESVDDALLAELADVFSKELVKLEPVEPEEGQKAESGLPAASEFQDKAQGAVRVVLTKKLHIEDAEIQIDSIRSATQADTEVEQFNTISDFTRHVTSSNPQVTFGGWIAAGVWVIMLLVLLLFIMRLMIGI